MTMYERTNPRNPTQPDPNQTLARTHIHMDAAARRALIRHLNARERRDNVLALAAVGAMLVLAYLTVRFAAQMEAFAQRVSCS